MSASSRSGLQALREQTFSSLAKAGVHLRAAAMEADMAHSSAGSAEAVSLAPPPLPDESRRVAANFAVWASEAETLRAAAQADAVPRDTRSGLPLDAATCLRRGCQECAVPRHEGLKCASR